MEFRSSGGTETIAKGGWEARDIRRRVLYPATEIFTNIRSIPPNTSTHLLQSWQIDTHPFPTKLDREESHKSLPEPD